MKTRSRVILVVAGIFFVLLWALRFVVDYGASQPVPFAGAQLDRMNYVQAEESYMPARSKANYASNKVVVVQSSQSQVIDQKYEQVASLDVLSTNWDNDMQRIRQSVETQKGVIQEESSSGLGGSRRARIRIGVVPDNFEAAVEELRRIGKLEGISVNKTDRTGDYQALEARRMSLFKTRDGLIALRRPGAALDDLMNLESRILEIEGQIQELGVSLGDFEETRSLCTVEVSLSERPAEISLPPVLPALLDSLAWAAWVWFGLILAALTLSGLVLLAGILMEKLLAWKARLDASGTGK